MACRSPSWNRLFGLVLFAGLVAACAPRYTENPEDPEVPAVPTSPDPDAPEEPSTPPPPPPPAPEPPPKSGYSKAAMRWTPGNGDSCTQDDHLRYTAQGPDGLLYPTWHPAVDPATGCTFGHEHGYDPSQSSLSDMGPLIFGYANEQLDDFPGRMPRHEDHVGHKIEGANGVVFTPANKSTASAITCDALTKLHQGTHSADAFTNNLHEIIYRLRCSDGTEVNVTFITANGPGGQLSRRCQPGTRIEAGTPNPADSPRRGHSRSPGRSMGNRFIPDRWCVENAAASTQYSEVWKTQNVVTTAENKLLFRFANYYFVSNPARYFSADSPTLLERPLESCFEKDADGSWSVNRSICKDARKVAESGPIAWDSPLSPFRGTIRTVRLNDMVVTNSGAQTEWYTDPFGQNARSTPFPGSIKQLISNTNHSDARAYLGPTIKGNYSEPTIRGEN